jgi:outer membrane protein
MKYKLIYTCLLSLMSALSIGQESFSLSEAKSYALSHHLSIQNAALNTENAVNKKNETRGIGLPQADITGTFNYFMNLPVQVVDASFINPNAKPGETVSFRAGTDYSSSTNLQVSQLIFNGSYLVGLQVSKLYVDFQRTFEEQSKEKVVFQVVQAYQLASVAMENQRFMDSMVRTTEKLVKQQEAYLELGLMKSEDMDQMNFSLLQAKSAQRQAKMQVQNAFVMLKLAMNFPIEQEMYIKESEKQLMSNSNVSVSGSVMDNIQVDILSQSILLNQYNLKNLKYASLPSLGSFFQQGYNAYRNEFDFFQSKPWFSQTLVGLQLTVPVFSGGQRHYRVQQARVDVMKSQNELEMLKNGLKAQEVQYRNNLTGAIDKYNLQEANMDLAQKIYDNTLIKKEIGGISSLEVTQKYNQLISAQSQFMASKLEVLNAKLSLEKLYNKLLTTNK